MRLPGLVARACFRWRLWKQTPRRTNLEGAPSRGLRHGHVGSDDGPYRGDCSETVDMAWRGKLFWRTLCQLSGLAALCLHDLPAFCDLHLPAKRCLGTGRAIWYDRSRVLVSSCGRIRDYGSYLGATRDDR